MGSGKSELLRTLVAGLAATHRPDEVELAFADFKGGLTFSALQTLPHCSGMVTNLADDLSLVDRMKAALVGELERRQLMLRAAGEDVQRIGQYRALREHRPELPAMPFLVVVVDEFGELLEARPDVLEVLLSIGRTGRSLGVHLVLASQRLEAGRIRGLDSYLGYRICLRTFTAEDSVAVLGTRAAADLPALPGHGYLRTADGVVRFLGATVSGRGDNTAGRRSVRLFTGGELPATAPPLATTLGEGESDLAVLVRRARSAGAGLERPPLWLPPLPAPADPRPLVLGDERLVVDLPSPAQGLPVPVGLVDHPRVRRQTPLQLDPAALDGHLLVVGAPQSGKSTVLAAFATSRGAPASGEPAAVPRPRPRGRRAGSARRTAERRLLRGWSGHRRGPARPVRTRAARGERPRPPAPLGCRRDRGLAPARGGGNGRRVRRTPCSCSISSRRSATASPTSTSFSAVSSPRARPPGCTWR